MTTAIVRGTVLWARPNAPWDTCHGILGSLPKNISIQECPPSVSAGSASVGLEFRHLTYTEHFQVYITVITMFASPLSMFKCIFYFSLKQIAFFYFTMLSIVSFYVACVFSHVRSTPLSVLHKFLPQSVSLYSRGLCAFFSEQIIAALGLQLPGTSSFSISWELRNVRHTREMVNQYLDFNKRKFVWTFK